MPTSVNNRAAKIPERDAGSLMLIAGAQSHWPRRAVDRLLTVLGPAVSRNILLFH